MKGFISIEPTSSKFSLQSARQYMSGQHGRLLLVLTPKNSCPIPTHSRNGGRKLGVKASPPLFATSSSSVYTVRLQLRSVHYISRSPSTTCLQRHSSAFRTFEKQHPIHVVQSLYRAPLKMFSPVSPSGASNVQKREHFSHSHKHDHGLGLGHHHHHHDNTYLLSVNKNDAAVRITRIGLFINLAMAIGKGMGGYAFRSQGERRNSW